MEHINVTQLTSGYYKLVPDNGYRLYNQKANAYYAVAVTLTPNEFIAVGKQL